MLDEEEESACLPSLASVSGHRGILEDPREGVGEVALAKPADISRLTHGIKRDTPRWDNSSVISSRMCRTRECSSSGGVAPVHSRGKLGNDTITPSPRQTI
jgi:hypothetical protein